MFFASVCGNCFHVRMVILAFGFGVGYLQDKGTERQEVNLLNLCLWVSTTELPKPFLVFSYHCPFKGIPRRLSRHMKPDFLSSCRTASVEKIRFPISDQPRSFNPFELSSLSRGVLVYTRTQRNTLIGRGAIYALWVTTAPKAISALLVATTTRPHRAATQQGHPVSR